MKKMTFLYNYIYMNIILMTNNLKKNNYTAVLGSESGPGLDLDLRSGSRVCKKWLDQTWTRPWTVYTCHATAMALTTK